VNKKRLLRCGSLRSVFPNEPVHVQIARLVILYEDLKIEHQGIVDRIAGLGETNDGWYAQRYFLRRAGVEARFHDLRHTVVTEQLEAGVPADVVKDTFGHVGDQILRNYTHIRMKAKQEALKRVQERRKAELGDLEQ
jgi:integrase